MQKILNINIIFIHNYIKTYAINTAKKAYIRGKCTAYNEVWRNAGAREVCLLGVDMPALRQARETLCATARAVSSI